MPSTRVLAIASAVVISLMLLSMTRFDWYAREMASQILRVQVPNSIAFDNLFDNALIKYTSSSELINVDTVHNGTLTELTYSIGMKKSNQIQEFLPKIRRLNDNNKVTLTAGHNSTDL